MTGFEPTDRGTGGDPLAVDVQPSREAVVGDTPVRRALPQRGRRTVGAWCFVDHLGPVSFEVAPGGIGPHPHTGLHTVTWLVEGEVLHRDSLGTEQIVRPGQLSLMTAGHGVSHAEEGRGTPGTRLHGVQLWVAQPEVTRHGAPAFEHHAALPQLDLGSARATVLLGGLAGATSPARTDTRLIGVDLHLAAGSAELPLEPTFEHALVVMEGAVTVGGRTVVPGQLAYLGTGPDELRLSAAGPTRLLLVGGEPFESEVTMWWNFVGRSPAEVAEAGSQWNAGSVRFGDTGSAMRRIPAPPAPPGRGRRPEAAGHLRASGPAQGTDSDVDRGRSEEEVPTDSV